MYYTEYCICSTVNFCEVFFSLHQAHSILIYRRGKEVNLAVNFEGHVVRSFVYFIAACIVWHFFFTAVALKILQITAQRDMGKHLTYHSSSKQKYCDILCHQSPNEYYQ